MRWPVFTLILASGCEPGPGSTAADPLDWRDFPDPSQQLPPECREDNCWILSLSQSAGMDFAHGSTTPDGELLGTGSFLGDLNFGGLRVETTTGGVEQWIARLSADGDVLDLASLLTTPVDAIFPGADDTVWVRATVTESSWLDRTLQLDDEVLARVELDGDLVSYVLLDEDLRCQPNGAWGLGCLRGSSELLLLDPDGAIDDQIALGTAAVNHFARLANGALLVTGDGASAGDDIGGLALTGDGADGFVAMLTANGDGVWVAPIERIAGDGEVTTSHLAPHADGDVTVNVTLHGGPGASFAWPDGSDPLLVESGAQRYLVHVEVDGQLKWTSTLDGGETDHGMALGPEEMIYQSTTERVWMLYPNGTLRGSLDFSTDPTHLSQLEGGGLYMANDEEIVALYPPK
jgi:hypothetical protein